MSRSTSTSRRPLLAVQVVLLVATATAQTPTPAASSSPASQPASAPAPLTAKVIEVMGDAEHAPLGSENWTPCKVGDEYGDNTVIQTGARSSVKLMVAVEDSYMPLLVDSISKVMLSDLWRDSGTMNLRVQQAYGKTRSGAFEGLIKTELTVDSTKMTLSKRGTWGIEVFTDKTGDQFEVGLLDSGLVDWTYKQTRQSGVLLPGERVVQALRYFLEQAEIDNNVAVADLLGNPDTTIVFNRLRTEGLGVIDVGSGRNALLNLSNRAARQDFATLARGALNQPVVIDPGGGNVGPIVRPEGFFGVGRGGDLVRVLIDQSNPLVQRGNAKPGVYRFRREALDGWVKSQRR